MTLVSRALPIALAAALAPSIAWAGHACDFYSGLAYTGEKFTLFNGHALQTQPGMKPGRTLPEGDDFQLFTDPRWRGKVRSVRVQPGCTGNIDDGRRSTRYSSDNPDTGRVGAEGISFACRCQ